MHLRSSLMLARDVTGCDSSLIIWFGAYMTLYSVHISRCGTQDLPEKRKLANFDNNWIAPILLAELYSNNWIFLGDGSTYSPTYILNSIGSMAAWQQTNRQKLKINIRKWWIRIAYLARANFPSDFTSEIIYYVEKWLVNITFLWIVLIYFFSLVLLQNEIDSTGSGHKCGMKHRKTKSKNYMIRYTFASIITISPAVVEIGVQNRSDSLGRSCQTDSTHTHIHTRVLSTFNRWLILSFTARRWCEWKIVHARKYLFFVRWIVEEKKTAKTTNAMVSFFTWVVCIYVRVEFVFQVNLFSAAWRRRNAKERRWNKNDTKTKPTKHNQHCHCSYLDNDGPVSAGEKKKQNTKRDKNDE